MISLRDDITLHLITFLKTKPRATKLNNREYIDTGNNRALVSLERHVVIFGRRGSGKTMLLGELVKPSGTSEMIWIDIDDYKKLTFPDILIQILRSLIDAIDDLVSTANTIFYPRRWWRTRPVLKRLRKEDEYLSKLLERFEDAEVTLERRLDTKSVQSRSAEVRATNMVASTLGQSRTREESLSESESAAGRDRKIDHIMRHMHDAKSIMRDALARLPAPCYLVLDDFYHLSQADQSQVLDYLQSLTKNLPIYIKFGTIAHRSSLYHRDAALIHGMQKEHDVLPIDLDRTFQNFQEVDQFITSLWGQIGQQVGANVDFNSLFAGDSWRQLILASGGVPRDFMNILARALDMGRARGKDKLDQFIVNEAANLYLRETKHDDLISDRADETAALEQMLVDIRNFCVNDRKRNLFLVDKDELEKSPKSQEMLRQLLDYRFVHLVHSNTSAAGKTGRYEAYMLDVGLYAHPQRRGENRVKQVDFLARDDEHRADAIRTQPIYPLRDSYAQSGESPFDAPVEIPDTDLAVNLDPLTSRESLKQREFGYLD
jgi:hypothetical protein